MVFPHFFQYAQSCLIAAAIASACSGQPLHQKTNTASAAIETNRQQPANAKRIEVYPANPAYWQYAGQPVILLGGSVNDNLFQIPNLTEHLELLRSVGGNYVRNTMSCRDPGNVWPFKKTNGKYDLNQWNTEYWRRFGNFLQLTCDRDIIVQIEVWATFDFYRQPWQQNPFNPKNNINYTSEQTGLPERVDSHPTRCENPFFWSVPAERNQKTVLKYQQRFVDKMLSFSLKFGHVLYCMDNETSVTAKWGKYWAQYIKARAKKVGLHVHTTEMWDAHDLAHPMHRATFDHPETYSFVDISQNNHQRGQNHWNNAQQQRARIAENPRPLNNVKIYGANDGPFGNDQDAMERFWRNIFGQMASARFHRPPAGLGLGPKAQANIRSARLLLDQIDIFSCRPHNDLLANRQSNEAYCLAIPGRQFAVYFTNGGQVSLDIRSLKSPPGIRWLNVMTSRWTAARHLPANDWSALQCPASGQWVALVCPHPTAENR